jgi:hypothetical protein
MNRSLRRYLAVAIIQLIVFITLPVTGLPQARAAALLLTMAFVCYSLVVIWRVNCQDAEPLLERLPLAFAACALSWSAFQFSLAAVPWLGEAAMKVMSEITGALFIFSVGAVWLVAERAKMNSPD